MSREHDLIAQLATMLAEFASPDGQHRALRSIYSPKGVCQVYPAGRHSGLCLSMFAVLREAADYLDEHRVEAPVLFSGNRVPIGFGGAS